MKGKNPDGTRKKRVPKYPFTGKGDPRNNLKGRPPLSQQQREFRQLLHNREEAVLESVDALIAKKDSGIVSKLIEKLAGQDSINVRVAVERELASVLDRIQAIVKPEDYERILTAIASEPGAEKT